MQEFILAKAEAQGTLIIENVAIDDTVGRVVDALYHLIEKTESADRRRAAS